ncbi:TPA: hypothetical protein PKT84_002343 [Acinetobacter baumannii]|uniref:hypothetical protein n=1 Tax=Acinetobacter baumannii TaxID=470 RepID=UPI0002AECB72|nr:hypothetical protein [Acinetobacter baumannii]ELW87800.1 hypothetical protein ACINAA014_2572 [Acinetobacter baumannii AA-014]EXA69433.1 putative membrane protein [Acinetobacter baumannii 984213]MBS4737526.1 hypothetical protein [Acinetobacter baumannii]MCH1775423.1 hypothetical protein [Acinetobacter baumannii]MCR0004666.1 hypothetical protein [Acinetobacter baumannii]
MKKLEKLFLSGLLGFPFLVAIWYGANKGYIYAFYGYVALFLMGILITATVVFLVLPSKQD